MTTLYVQEVSGNLVSAAEWNANFLLTQQSISDIGPLLISGLVPSAGAGLAVTVTAGVASIGGRITASGSFSIAGLANNTTNHLYLLDSGVGTSNTSGTQPADSVKLATCITAAGVVSSVDTTRASGRQAKVRTESLVHGGSAGNPRAVDLAQWAASTDQPNEVKGTLPAGAMAAWAISTKTTTYTIVDADAFIKANATGGAFTITLPTAVGRSGHWFEVKKIDTTANVITLKGDGSELIDTANTQLIDVPMAAIVAVSDGTQWWMA